MAKIIAWLILIFVVLFALRLIVLRNARAQRKRAESGAAGAGHGAEPMVRCVRCGVYLPRKEAQEVSGGYACATGECAGKR
ncbi:MAG TPA: PP0621 family protein [Casimicrobiaceae bacterium]